MNQKRKILSILLSAVSVICLLAALFIFIKGWIDDRRAEDVLDDYRVSHETDSTAGSSAQESSQEPSTEASSQVPSEPASEPSSGESASSEPMASESTSSEPTPGESASGEPAPDESASSEPSSGESASGEPAPDEPTSSEPSSSEPTSSEPAPTEPSSTVPEPDEPALVANPYEKSFRANKDMAAWLVIPDTVIDYPVMWTPEDENYYLYRDFEGRENKNGCLILDTDSSLDPLTTNLIIHGHNMKSGAMFGDLTEYEKKAYYEAHKQITLYTPECQRNYEVIAVFRSQVYRKSDKVFKFYQFFQADTEEEFNDFYQNIKDLSIYDTGVTAEFGDNFITLSTCVYHVENGRFVVVAKEVESGDSYLPLDE